MAPPPTIPDDHYDRVEGDELPVDAPPERSPRARVYAARIVGVLLILMTAGLAFATVGRAWIRSLPSVIWPSSLLRPEQPVLPRPLRPDDEPVRPAEPEAPPIVPPVESLPTAPTTTVAPVETAPTPRTLTLPDEKPAEQPRQKPRRPVQRETSEALPAPADPSPPVQAVPDEGMTPEELPARPTVDPASPEAPPAGEAPMFMQEGEGNGTRRSE